MVFFRDWWSCMLLPLRLNRPAMSITLYERQRIMCNFSRLTLKMFWRVCLRIIWGEDFLRKMTVMLSGWDRHLFLDYASCIIRIIYIKDIQIEWYLMINIFVFSKDYCFFYYFIEYTTKKTLDHKNPFPIKSINWHYIIGSYFWTICSYSSLPIFSLVWLPG